MERPRLRPDADHRHPRRRLKLDPATPLTTLDWITRKQSTSLTKLGLLTLSDLVTHYPRRHENRSRFSPFPDGGSETPVLLRGTLVKARYLPYGGWKKGFEATLEEPGGLGAQIQLRWFNMPYIGKQLAAGQTLVAYGKTKLRGKMTVIDFPEFEIIEEGGDPELIHLDRIVPVHPAGEGITPKKLRELIHRALEATDLDLIKSLLPNRESKIENRKFIHFPPSHEALATARQALIAEEFFAIQALIAARRARVATLPGNSKNPPGHLLDQLLANLPFAPTASQTQAIAEIRKDLAQPTRMTRLLQGDVGSGKTLIALAAALTAIESGHQAILMAPTQILAEQHHLNLTKLLAPLGIQVTLRMGRTGFQPVAAGILPAARASQDVRYSKRNLPHFERPWGKYHVTFVTKNHRHLPPAARQIVLDAILHEQSRRRYELYAACVMPDHVHLLIEPQIESSSEDPPRFIPLRKILHSIKSFTALRINQLQNTEGKPVWQEESHDRLIRSETDLTEKFHYVCRNAWTANLAAPTEDYPFVWWPNKAGQDARPDSLEGCSPPINHQPSTSNHPQLLIGTHALLHDPAELDDPGLVIIDEQHKFGVLQRAKLIEGPGTPDVLVMTATPIPRTLAQTAYGDLDVTTLDELPPGRGKIITGIRSAKKLPEAVKFLREQIQRGRQIYIVYPLVEESEKLQAKAAAAEFERWQPLLAPHTCGLLHGRLKSEEKDAVMTAFRSGETKALISTTVIEVGVDVPNATVMLIENAERFGLAQLHQLRGRIGRGQHTSYCILVPGKDTEEARAKLAILEETTDGFRVAEADLELRGPGDLIGTAQTGLPPLRLGDILRDHDQMLEARTLAQKIFAEDPHLTDPAHANLRAWLARQDPTPTAG